MAKKKKNKGEKADTKADSKVDSKVDSPASVATATAGGVPATGHKLVDAAYASGNYAALRHFAKTTPEAQKLLELTKIDMGQAIVGLIALIVVLSVAIATLH